VAGSHRRTPRQHRKKHPRSSNRVRIPRHPRSLLRQRRRPPRMPHAGRRIARIRLHPSRRLDRIIARQISNLIRQTPCRRRSSSLTPCLAQPLEPDTGLREALCDVRRRFRLRRVQVVVGRAGGLDDRRPTGARCSRSTGVRAHRPGRPVRIDLCTDIAAGCRQQATAGPPAPWHGVRWWSTSAGTTAPGCTALSATAAPPKIGGPNKITNVV
jgi:hypothetical protein